MHKTFYAPIGHAYPELELKTSGTRSPKDSVMANSMICTSVGIVVCKQIQIFLTMLYKHVVFHTNNGALLAIGRHVVLNLVQSMLYK